MTDFVEAGARSRGAHGQAYLALGQYEKALADLTLAVEVDPDLDWARKDRDRASRST